MEEKQDRKRGRYADVLTVGQERYTYFPVSRIPGSEKLPYSLTVLLENVLRNASSDEEAQRLAERIVEAGVAGRVGDEVEFSPARVLFQDFTGYRCSSTSLPCAKHARSWGAIRRRSTPNPL